MIDPAPTNYAEATNLMMLWATGERSHNNIMLQTESDANPRPQTIAAIVQADAAEVVKWGAVAQTFAIGEQLGYPSPVS